MKKMMSFTLIAAALICLSGCASEFDASKYVQSMLDTWYKGDYAEYMELTDATEEEAKKAYADNLEVEADYFTSHFYIEHISNETKQQVMDLYGKIYSEAKYEVKEAVKNKDGSYNVEVEIYPINIMKIIDNDYTSYLDEFNSKVQSGEYDELTDEEYEDKFTLGVISIIENHLAGLGYEDPKSLNVQVKQQENNKNMYYIDESEMNSIDEWILQY